MPVNQASPSSIQESQKVLGTQVHHPADNLLVCPHCAGPIVNNGSTWLCESCSTTYPNFGGISSLLVRNNLSTDPFTDRIRDFYEQNPFPAYDGVANRSALIARSANSFASVLDRSLPLGATVLELGCGTGQLTNFLGITGRTAIGADLSGASLSQAEAFRRQEKIDNARFFQMNIFNPAIRRESVDIVISMGVFHHTKVPGRAIEIAASLLKPGGYLIVGLYHTYARLGHRLRQRLYRQSASMALRLDPVFSRSRTDDRRRAWLFDQYIHPHETCHTSREVRGWFDKAGLTFIRSLPEYGISKSPFDASGLLLLQKDRHRFDSTAGEMMQMLVPNEDGGLFVTVGRKPAGDLTRKEVASPEATS